MTYVVTVESLQTQKCCWLKDFLLSPKDMDSVQGPQQGHSMVSTQNPVSMPNMAVLCPTVLDIGASAPGRAIRFYGAKHGRCRFVIIYSRDCVKRLLCDVICLYRHFWAGSGVQT